jgi:hypothetical protein
MPQLKRLWVGMETRTSEDAETDSRIALSVDAHQMTLPDSKQFDQERGAANLYFRDVEDHNVAPENLNDSSIRMEILDNDAWAPKEIFVWGEQLADGAPVPVALETEIQQVMSTDYNEGHVGLPLRLVNHGDITTTINRLLVVMLTDSVDQAGTNDAITLQITTGGARFVDFTFASTEQADQEQSQANFYYVPVETPFSKGRLLPDSIKLMTNGNDAWLPAQFFVFGLDTETGRPGAVVPLVNIQNWQLGALSTDPSEGAPMITVPLVA